MSLLDSAYFWNYCKQPLYFCNLFFLSQEYLDFLEKVRVREMESLARKYRAIGPLLTKMEGLVVHTNTGKSSKMREYYQYWENRVFQSLLKVGIWLYKNFEANVVAIFSVHCSQFHT